MAADFHVHEDGSRLQKLTAQQVEARLAAYNSDGAFEADLHALWRDASGILEPVVRDHAGDDIVRQFRERCTSPVDSDWVHAIAGYGIELHSRRRSVPEVIDRRARLTAKLAEALRRNMDDEAALAGAMETLMRLRAYETDIILAQIGLLEADEAAAARGRQSDTFERTLIGHQTPPKVVCRRRSSY